MTSPCSPFSDVTNGLPLDMFSDVTNSLPLQEQSLELEKKRFRFQLEAEEKRLMMESDHYRKMENLFTGLISVSSQSPHVPLS